jgi:hypothetical protein
LLDPETKRFKVKQVPCEKEECTCKAVIRVGELWHKPEIEVQASGRYFEAERPAEETETEDAKNKRDERSQPFRSSAQLGDPFPDGCCGFEPKGENGCSYEDCLFKMVPLYLRVAGDPPKTFDVLKRIEVVPPGKDWLHKLTIKYKYICGKDFFGERDWVNWDGEESAYAWLGDGDFTAVPIKQAFNSSPRRGSRGLPDGEIPYTLRKIDRRGDVYFSVSCGCTLAIEVHVDRIGSDDKNRPKSELPSWLDALPFALPAGGRLGDAAADAWDIVTEVGGDASAQQVQQVGGQAFRALNSHAYLFLGDAEKRETERYDEAVKHLRLATEYVYMEKFRLECGLCPEQEQRRRYPDKQRREPQEVTSVPPVAPGGVTYSSSQAVLTSHHAQRGGVAAPFHALPVLAVAQDFYAHDLISRSNRGSVSIVGDSLVLGSGRGGRRCGSCHSGKRCACADGPCQCGAET